MGRPDRDGAVLVAVRADRDPRCRAAGDLAHQPGGGRRPALDPAAQHQRVDRGGAGGSRHVARLLQRAPPGARRRRGRTDSGPAAGPGRLHHRADQ
ncbi:hypothetical protein G6F24_015710 [Rhizopus arrhizus]|nr:hypothetical protein G6F24_015710 [Rhizopus arrhizus]